MSTRASQQVTAGVEPRASQDARLGRRVAGRRAALGTLAAVGVLSSSTGAWASTQRFGTAATPGAPSCPGLPCQALTRTTGFQAAIGGSHNAMVVGQAGRVVSWTITLSKPNADEVSFFDQLTGGPPQAALVTLRQGANYRFRVVGVTPTVLLTPILGTTSVFTLAEPLSVTPGEVLGLSIPTWAPTLALGGSSGMAWRASRAHGSCDDVTSPTYEITPGGLGQFECVYHNGLLAYGATVTTSPPPPPARRRSAPGLGWRGGLLGSGGLVGAGGLL